MKIVVLDGQTLNPGDNPWDAIDALGDLSIFPKTDPAEIVDRLRGADIAVTNKAPISRETIEQLDQLKFISVTATGFNIVDTLAASENSITVSNVPIYGTDTVAQHVFAVLLSFIHRPNQHDQSIRDGEWQKRGDFSFWLNPLAELAGQTMGIVGFGRIGQRVAELANAFKMKVVAYNPSEKPLPSYEDFQFVSLQEVFERADVLSLNCPQTDSNKGFVNEAFISRMKQTAILINASRGGLIHDVDLTNALNNEKIAGACLDVFAEEPIADSNPLLNAKNCLMTPHYAWATVAARKRLMQSTADNIRAFQNGQPTNVVNL